MYADPQKTQEMKKDIREVYLYDAFLAFDTNHDNTISKEDLMPYLNQIISKGLFFDFPSSNFRKGYLKSGVKISIFVSGVSFLIS